MSVAVLRLIEYLKFDYELTARYQNEMRGQLTGYTNIEVWEMV